MATINSILTNPKYNLRRRMLKLVKYPVDRGLEVSALHYLENKRFRSLDSKVYRLYDSGIRRRGLLHHIDRSYNGPLPLPEELRKRYRPFGKLNFVELVESRLPQKIDDSTLEVLVKKIDSRPAFNIYDIQFPPLEESNRVQNIISLRYFEQNKDGKFPTVIFFPMSARPAPVSHLLSRFFSSQGMNCAIMRRPLEREDALMDITTMEEELQNIIVRYEQAVDWVYSREKVDAGRMGTVGISLGGVESSVIAAIDPRLKYHIVALAGAPLPEMIRDSTESGLVRRRTLWKEANNLSDAQLYEKLVKTIKTDPSNLAPYIDARKVFMIRASRDTAVPSKLQEKLWEAIGKPDCVSLPTGHLQAALYLPYIIGKSLELFHEKLG